VSSAGWPSGRLRVLAWVRSWPQAAGIAGSPVLEGLTPHLPGAGWADREKGRSRWTRPQAGQRSASSRWWVRQTNAQPSRQVSAHRPPVTARHSGQNRDPRARPHSTCELTFRFAWPIRTARSWKRIKVMSCSCCAPTPVADEIRAASSSRSAIVQSAGTATSRTPFLKGEASPRSSSTSPRRTLSRQASASSQESRASPGSGAKRIGKVRDAVMTLWTSCACCRSWW
jgi:hypothetical protein